MNMIEQVVKLVSKLPPEAYDLLLGIVNTVLKAKSPDEAKELLRKAALAIGYKEAAKKGWRAAVKASGKI